MSQDVVPQHRVSHWLGSLPDFRASRLQFQLDLMRAHPRISSVRFGVFDVLVVFDPELFHEVLIEQADNFMKSYGLSLFARPVLGDGLLTSEQELHRRQRRLMAPMFTQRQVAAYARVMGERAERSVNAMLQAGVVDVSERAMQVTLEIVGKALFDAELADAASEVGQCVTDAMESVMGTMTSALPLPPFVPTPHNLRLHRTIKRLDRLVYAMIRERRAQPAGRDDLMSLLLAARDEQDGSGMTDTQVRDEVMTALLAGHETTANVLAWALVLLADQPELRARVERELDSVLHGGAASLSHLSQLPLTLRVLKETLRLRPSVYLLGRRALKPTRIGGYRVRKNQVVLLGVYGMHHRPDLYPDPERFDPDRFLPEREKNLPRHAFAPFGGGQRTCIGNHFALLEGHLLLATWLSRARFTPTAPGSVEFEPLMTLRPKGPVTMQVTARSAPAVAE
ncbi:MAG TPA: cytochrome P450 [Polyangiales bacterium]